MQIPLEISFRNMAPSEAVEAKVRERAVKLDRFHGRITRCRVVVGAPHRHRHKGKLYAVRIDLTLPGGEIVVDTEKRFNHAHEDVYVAIRDAFDSLRRRLEDHGRRHRGDTKWHEPPPHGIVSKLFADYGFITAAAGHEIYFHRNSVAGGGFDSLEMGSEVRFTETAGEQGPQASTVHAVGKHHVTAPDWAKRR